MDNQFNEKQELFNKYGYEPFYCVHYHDWVEMRWVRNPFLTWDEVQEVWEALPVAYDEDRGVEVPLFSDFVILPEGRLSKLDRDWDEEKEEWSNAEITNRQMELDCRYESTAEHITGERSLARKTEKQHAWISIGEPLESEEEWRERVSLQEAARDAKNEQYHAYLNPLIKERQEARRRVFGAPSPFLTGNCTFRAEMEGAEDMKRQMAEYAVQRALKEEGGKGFGQ